MFVLIWIRRAYKALSADASPSAIAFGAAFGLTAGCVPMTSGMFWLLLVLLLVLRVQISAGLLFWFIGRAITVVGGVALFDQIGHALLYSDGLRSFWTWLLNAPGAAWLGLEVPAILGGVVFGLVVGAVQFVPLRLTVIAYRRWAHEKLSKNRFFRWLTGFWFVKVLRFIFIG